MFVQNFMAHHPIDGFKSLGKSPYQPENVTNIRWGKAECGARILAEFRIYFNQTRVGECWNSGKSKSGSFILFLLSLNVFYDALYVFYRF